MTAYVIKMFDGEYFTGINSLNWGWGKLGEAKLIESRKEAKELIGGRFDSGVVSVVKVNITIVKSKVKSNSLKACDPFQDIIDNH